MGTYDIVEYERLLNCRVVFSVLFQPEQVSKRGRGKSSDRHTTGQSPLSPSIFSLRTPYYFLVLSGKPWIFTYSFAILIGDARKAEAMMVYGFMGLCIIFSRFPSPYLVVQRVEQSSLG